MVICDMHIVAYTGIHIQCYNNIKIIYIRNTDNSVTVTNLEYVQFQHFGITFVKNSLNVIYHIKTNQQIINILNYLCPWLNVVQIHQYRNIYHLPEVFNSHKHLIPHINYQQSKLIDTLYIEVTWNFANINVHYWHFLY